MTQNIIFDLGGVLIDLDIDAALNQLAKLTGKSRNELSTFYNSKEIHKYEKGLISDDMFRKSIRHLCESELSDQSIDVAWNSMLLDIPEERMALVKKLASDYQLIVLSNTNGIHVRRFNQILKANTGKEDLNDFFEVVYFSHEIKMRKPDLEIFQFVLEKNHLKPQETLFLDDNMTNLTAAQKLGIKTQHIDHPNRLFEIF